MRLAILYISCNIASKILNYLKEATLIRVVKQFIDTHTPLVHGGAANNDPLPILLKSKQSHWMWHSR
jgi:hypothetical protein